MDLLNFQPKNKLLLSLTVLFLVSGLMVLPIYWFGIPHGNDLPQHYQFALTFRESLQNGIFYPSWAATANYGFGDVGIRFYPPLAYYVLVFFEWLAGDWYFASILTFWFWFFLSGIGVYFWSREWFSEYSSLLAAIVYIFAPYHANQIYNAFTYAEFASASILPFCFLFVTRLCRQHSPFNIIGLGIFYALLILTHLPMTVIGSLALLVYSLASIPRAEFFKKSFSLGISVILGLLASSFYWVRMVSELKFVNLTTTELTSGAYDFHKNFIVSFFYLTSTEYDERSLWFCDLMLLITAGLFIPMAIIFYRTTTKNRPQLFGVMALLVFAIFIATPLSLPIWENLEFLQKVQFPWRWLTVITLSCTIFIAAGFENLPKILSTDKRPLAILALGLIFAGLVFTVTQIIKPAMVAPHLEFNARISKLDRTESFPCWWTIWSKKEAFENKEKVTITNRNITILEWTATNRKFQITEGNGAEARIATMYYPHWKAKVNEIPIEVKMAADGTILIPLNAEQSTVYLWFEEPKQIQIASNIALFTWLILGLSFVSVIFLQYFHQKQQKS